MSRGEWWDDAAMQYRIIHGDSRTSIPDEGFELVVTSPPYNVGKPYAGHDDAIPLDEWRQLVTDVLGQAWDRLVEGGRLCVNVQHGVGRSPMVPLSNHVESIGHALPDSMYRGAVVWHKGPVNTTAWGSWLSPSNPVLRGSYEMVHVWSKGSLSRVGGEGDMDRIEFTEATLDTWHIHAETSRGVHPAPFPVALAERLIKLYTWEGDRVLDPFSGVGSSGVAAKRLARAWVGVDTSADYCEVAGDRLEGVSVNSEPVAVPVVPSDELSAVAGEYAKVLARGAYESGLLEIRRGHITRTVDSWERYRRTLSNQVTVGAYAVVTKRDGSRVFWVTANGKSQRATLMRWSAKPIRAIKATTVEELEAKLLDDVSKVLVDASGDRRSRAVTARELPEAITGILV